MKRQRAGWLNASGTASVDKEGHMPRLEGARTNMVPYILGLVVLIILALLAAELTGVVDVVDGFGPD